MNAITNSTESDSPLHLIKKKKALDTTENKLNVNTLVPTFAFLNHKGEKIAAVPSELF